VRLTKASALADQWDMDEAELKRRARRYGWPCVRLSRTDWRFTDQQIEQIVAMQSRAAKPVEKKTAGTGQSKRSASRAT
jgi:hypothetical protein